MARFTRVLLMFSTSILTGAVALAGLQIPVFGLVLLGSAGWHRFRRRQPSDAYGSARLAGYLDLWGGGLLGEHGLIMGDASIVDPLSRWQAIRCLFSRRVGSAAALRIFAAAFRRRGDTAKVRVADGVHGLVVVPSGAGKG